MFWDGVKKNNLIFFQKQLWVKKTVFIFAPA
jgi:hypothetical protein